MTQLDLDFQALTGLNYTVSDIIENASTDEEKQKAYNFITWNIKQGRILEVPTNAILVKSIIDEIKDLNIIESGSESEENEYYKQYFTIRNIDKVSGTISYNGYNTNTSKDIPEVYSLNESGTINDNTLEVYYSLNNGDWESWIAETEITLNQNDSIRIKCNAKWNYPEDYDGSVSPLDFFTGIHGDENKSAFNVKFNFEVCGNIMSLLYGDNFKNQTDISEIPMVFMGLFASCDTLINAANLILPATTLADRCYNYMFAGCTSLTTTPALPATTLSESCYQSMFENCTSLTTAPKLPATTLADYCYQTMFAGCTSLTVAPELLATTLVTGCYNEMFYDCTSLTTAPELPATTLARECYASMFDSCTSLITAPVLPATILADYCYDSMFYGCTSLTTAPELPATTLVEGCYNSMFYGCTVLNYIKCLATDISAPDCTNSWVQNVSNTGTFVNADTMVSWSIGDSGIPSGWNYPNPINEPSQAPA